MDITITITITIITITTFIIMSVISLWAVYSFIL
jgi:hypothetical protein